MLQMQQMILELALPPAPTLENFFPGRNAAALAALRSALEGGERFVYLWGGPGAGKSHLLQAFALAGRDAGRPGSLAADDVEKLDIIGQLELFDAYNERRASGGAIAAAGDRPAPDLPLREDLRTRIASGITLQLHPLNDEEKRAALAAQAAQRGLQLPDEIIAYVLARHSRDMGSLVALLDALDRYSLQTRRPITLPLLRDALREAPKR
jgi:DnaA family protein